MIELQRLLEFTKQLDCMRRSSDLKRTQSLLGHASIGITSDVYVHLQPDSEVESMKKLEQTFFSELCSTVLTNWG